MIDNKIRELVAKWDKEADGYGLIETKAAKRSCARELEAALSAAPQPAPPDAEPILWTIAEVREKYFLAGKDAPTDSYERNSALGAMDALDELSRKIHLGHLAAQPQPASTGEGGVLAKLVADFSAALLEKLQAAEKKYGYRNDWMRPDWMDTCRQHLREHLGKGDPRDVAAYCAFLWHHKQSTVATGGETPDNPDHYGLDRPRESR